MVVSDHANNINYLRASYNANICTCKETVLSGHSGVSFIINWQCNQQWECAGIILVCL